MPEADLLPHDFPYGGLAPSCGLAGDGPPITLSVFADRAHLRATMREDVEAVGIRVTKAGALSDLLEGGALPLGDIVFVDCPQVHAATLAALARLDLRAARCQARLIVSTSVEALDMVFACMDQSSPVLLVDATRAERAIALGHTLANLTGRSVRELSDNDRLMLLRLSEQVGQIAGQIERLAPGGQVKEASPGMFRFGQPSSAGLLDEVRDLPTTRRRAVRPPLPDARLVRKIIRQRQQRGRYLDAGLFADPAWDMLLDLTAARVEHKRVSVTSLCIASGVPPTTALRWIGQMIDAGLFVRVCDDTDRRRAFIEMTEKAVDAMAQYFAEAL